MHQRLKLGRALATLVNPAVVAQHIVPGRRPSRGRLAPVRRRSSDRGRLARQAGGDRLGDRVVGPCGEAACNAYYLIFRQRLSPHQLRHELGLALGQRAGLVQRDDAQLARLLQVDPPLMRMPRRAACREAADDGDRRGDDQGAGQAITSSTSAFVIPVNHGQPKTSGVPNADSERQREDSRRVDGRKAVDKALVGARCACAASTA